MKYEVMIVGGDTIEIECEWIETTSDWVKFEKPSTNSGWSTTVALLRSESVVSVDVAE